MYKILVTGGSGFIGTNLIEYLIKKNFYTINMDIAEPRKKSHKKYFKQNDILNVEKTKNFINSIRPDFIIHLAARTDLDGETLSDYSVNTVGTQNIIEAIQSTNSVKRCLFTTSKLVCHSEYVPNHDEDYSPHTLYGESKVIAEKIIRKSNIGCTWCIGRPSSIWGPWFDIPYLDFFKNVSKGRYWHPGGINPAKSFGYVGNVVHQIVSLLFAPDRKVHKKTFYWSDYESITIKQWADCISEKLNHKTIKEIPEIFFKILAFGGDILKIIGVNNPPLTSFRLKNIKADTSGIPLDEMNAISGPLPYNYEQGVEETIGWLKRQNFI